MVKASAPEIISMVEMAKGCAVVIYFLFREVNVAANAALSNPVKMALVTEVF